MNLDLVALALTPWTIMAQGNGFGLGNYDTILAFIRRINERSYLVGDWMLSTPPVHPVLLRLIAPFCDLWSESWAFLLVHCLTRVILLTGLWRLSDALLPGRRLIATVFMVAILFEPRLHLGDHYLSGGHWEPAFLGMAFVPWIIAEAIKFIDGRGHWISFALVSGFGIFSHFFICLPIAGIAWCLAVVQSRSRWREMLGVIASGLVIGSPVLVPALRGYFFPAESPLTSQQVIAILQFRHPHHHQPWTWPVRDFLEAIFFLAATCIVWARIGAAFGRRMILPLVLLIYFVLSAIAFTYFGARQQLPILAFLQCFRLLSPMLMLGFLGILGAWDTIALENRRAAIIAGAVALVAFRFPGLGGPVVAGTIGLFLAYKIPRANGVSALEQRLPKFISWGLMILGAVGIFVLQLSAPARAFLNRFHPGHWRTEAEAEDPARDALAKWVRANTSPDALFAIPPDMPYFRIWERRAIIVDMKNIPYENAALKEWADRIRDAGVDDPYAAFTVPSEEDPTLDQMVEFARRYRAEYLVSRQRKNNPGAIYNAGGFCVYRVPELQEQILDQISIEPPQIKTKQP